MTKNMLVVVLAAVGCGNVMNPSGGSDDAADLPDGGVDAETPVDPAVLSIVPTQWKDERSDAIDFSTGEPVHTHQGPAVTIASGGACPAAYRYAYLMDRAPAFGRQVTQNAIEIEVAVPTIPLDASASSYRLTTAGGMAVIPWTSIGAVPESGRIRVAMHRDDVAALGTYDGELHFDVRVRDTAGVEQVASACWVNHPMAAPLKVEAAQSALGSTSLTARLLSTVSGAVDVIVPGGSPPDVYSARITQQTAEPVVLSFATTAPAGTFTSTLARVYLATGTLTAPGNCDDYPESCDQSPPPALAPIAASGALTSGTWSWTLVDETATQKMTCPAGVCTIPGRTAGAAPHAYRVTIAGTGFSNLWPHPTLASLRELTVAAGTVAGVWVTSNKVTRCTHLRTIGGVTACSALAEYTELVALDRATLAMPPTTVQVLTGSPATPVPYLNNGAVPTPPVNWNGGDGPL